MKLYAVKGSSISQPTQAHDRRVVRPCRDLKFRRDRASLHDEAVVPCCREWVREALENSPPVMVDVRRLPVHDGISPPNHHTVRRPDALVAQAHPEYRNPTPECRDDLIADPRFQRCAGSRREQDVTWSQPFYCCDVDPVIPFNAHFERRIKRSNRMDQIPCK